MYRPASTFPRWTERICAAVRTRPVRMVPAADRGVAWRGRQARAQTPVGHCHRFLRRNEGRAPVAIGSGRIARTPEDPKARVLAAALVLFGEQGYGGTSLQDIGDRLGVTKAAVYYHWRAKVALLASVAEPLLHRMDGVIESAPGTWSQAGCRDLLGDYVDAVLEARIAAKVLIKDPTAADQPAAAKMRVQRRRLRNLLAPPSGERQAGKVLAACALGALEGAMLDFSDLRPERHRDTMLDAAIRALVAVPGPRAPMAGRR